MSKPSASSVRVAVYRIEVKDGADMWTSRTVEGLDMLQPALEFYKRYGFTYTVKQIGFTK